MKIKLLHILALQVLVAIIIAVNPPATIIKDCKMYMNEVARAKAMQPRLDTRRAIHAANNFYRPVKP